AREDPWIDHRDRDLVARFLPGSGGRVPRSRHSASPGRPDERHHPNARRFAMTGRHSSAHLTLKCIEPDQCSVVFEPYGSEVILVAEDEIRLSFNCRDEPRIEVAYSP